MQYCDEGTSAGYYEITPAVPENSLFASKRGSSALLLRVPDEVVSEILSDFTQKTHLLTQLLAIVYLTTPALGVV